MKQREFNLNKAIFTPLERWVDCTVELDTDIVAHLYRLAKTVNQSVDNVVNHILGDVFAAHLDMANLSAETLREAAKECKLILLLDDGKPIVRVEMLDKKDMTCASKNECMPLQADAARAEVKQTECISVAGQREKSA